MMKKNSDFGFSLTELVVVIAMIAVLIGILAPQYLKYVSKAKRSVCLTDMNTLITTYELDAVLDPPANIEEAKALLKKIMEANGGNMVSEGSGFYTGGFFSGICKADGTYSCLLSDDFLVLSIDCSVHGSSLIDVKILKDRLERITFDDIPGFVYHDLNEYFAGHPSLDSEAVNTDTNYGKYGSLAQAVSEKLLEQGINMTDRSWRMYKRGGEYNLFLANRKITQDQAETEEWVECVKYDIANEKVITGKAKVIMSTTGNYAMIDGSSFKEIK